MIPHALSFIVFVVLPFMKIVGIDFFLSSQKVYLGRYTSNINNFLFSTSLVGNYCLGRYGYHLPRYPKC